MISFTIGWFDLLAVQELSPAPQFKSIDSLVLSLLYGPSLTFLHDLYGPILTSEHNYWKHNSFVYIDFVGKLLSLFLNTLFVTAFLPRSKHLLILWLLLLFEVTFQNPGK